MADIIFSESAYRFSEPVRTFKANDPYYYEVDNIPVKQLEENCLWLKDQLTGGPIEIKNIKRAEWAELKPSTGGGTRTVSVNPGRFTARVNDAYYIQPLASLKRNLQNIEGITSYTGPNFNFESVINHKWEYVQRGPASFEPGEGFDLSPEDLDKILEAWQNQSIITEGAPGHSVSPDGLERKQLNRLGFNGLAERAFAYPTKNSVAAVISDYSTSGGSSAGGTPDIGTFLSTPLAGRDDVPYPVFQALLWESITGGQDTTEVECWNWTDESKGFLSLPRLENLLIKRWRGIARTAVCDVPAPLQISIPPFDPDDFDAVDSNGAKVNTGGTQRIDLLFLYSKPVDTEKTTIINPSVPGSLQHLNQPKLGLVRGAGLGINAATADTGTNSEAKDAYREDGHLIMLADPRDENSTVNGFLNTQQADVGNTQHEVHGSFPSPDDLLNLSPALLEELEGTEWDLVGQSVLPLAYIVTRQGKSSLSTNDIIDIRPFLRTAELTYNERSGIAAAYPPLSLANPAVGKRDLDRIERGLREGIKGLIPTLTDALDAAIDKIPLAQPKFTCGLRGRHTSDDTRLLNASRHASPMAGQNQNISILDVENSGESNSTEGQTKIRVEQSGIYLVSFDINTTPQGVNHYGQIFDQYLNIVEYGNPEGEHRQPRMLNEGTADATVNEWYVFPTYYDMLNFEGEHPLQSLVGQDSSDFEMAGGFHFKKVMTFEALDEISLRISHGDATQNNTVAVPHEQFGSLSIERLSNLDGGLGQYVP